MAVNNTLKKEARKFAESTSVRGIPRALKTKDKGLRAIWFTAVLVCVSLLIWQTTTVVLRYFRYDSSTLFTEGTGRPVSATVLPSTSRQLTI